jgi:hypothetical protein
VEIVNDVLVLADMESHKLLVGNGLCFDVFGSVGVLQGIDRFLELTP